MSSNVQRKVDDLIEHMKTGRIIEAVETYYDTDVVMQENRNPPTVGLSANLEREREFLANVKEWHSLDVHALAVSGSDDNATALIEYSFDFTNQADQPVRYEQVAVQQWKNGKVVRERFYYDSAG